MTSTTSPVSADPSATHTISPLGQLAYRDDLEIARRRMKHLAPWHVEPMRMTQEVASAPANRKLSVFGARHPTTFQRSPALRLFVAERPQRIDADTGMR